MNITVIGSGYVGTTTALVLAHIGHHVIGYDVDKVKVNKLNSGMLPFVEPGLEQLLREVLDNKAILFTSDPQTAITQSDILMIAVGTPSTSNGNADLTYLAQSLDVIANYINDSKIVVTKSTVPIGTNRWMKQQLMMKIDTAQYPIEVISNPEFLREGSALHDSLHPSRTVIGGENTAAIETVKEMYASLNAPQFVCSYETAELIKYASNGFLAAKISYINEIARLADEIGADIDGVAVGMGMDPRISPHHMRAGLGYGGSCFPKDVNELLYFARQKKVNMPLLQRVRRINDTQIDWFVQKMEATLPLEGKRLLVLGITFKEDTDDQRESPGIRMIEQLLKKGVEEIRVIDPTITSVDQIRWSSKLHVQDKNKVKMVVCEEEAADHIHAVLLTTSWPIFNGLPWDKWVGKADSAYLFDGRNYLDPSDMRRHGWHYVGVARGEGS